MAMADDVEEFMQDQHLVKPTLIGHSMYAATYLANTGRDTNRLQGVQRQP